MNRTSDPDAILAAWLDEGAQRAPERFVWAALEQVERIPQPGGWRIALENLTMPLKIVATAAGAAALLALGLAAYQLFAGSNVGTNVTDPRLLTVDDLARIVVEPTDLAKALHITREFAGPEALSISGAAPADSRGFLDGRLLDLDDDDNPDTGHFEIFAGVFETQADAELAFDAAVATYEFPDRWGLDPASLYRRVVGSPGLGDEGASYVTRLSGGTPDSAIYVWRVNNVLLHAVGIRLFRTTEYGYLRSIAEGMDARAH